MDEEQSQVSTGELSRGPYAGDSQHRVAEFVLVLCLEVAGRSLRVPEGCPPASRAAGIECEEDGDGRRETTGMTLRRRSVPRRQEGLIPSTAAAGVSY